MGSSTQARCRSCGYDSDMLIVGSGMMEGNLYWPVICEKCEEVTTANFERPRLQCRKCRTTRVIRISASKVWKGDGNIVQEWGDYFVTDGHYQCPKCKKFELEFGESDIQVQWD